VDQAASIAPAVQAYAEQLCANLAIPATPHADLVQSSSEPLTIGGEAVTVGVDQFAESAWIPARLCHSIYRGRECFVTSEVARYLRQDWGLDDSNWPLDVFRNILRQTVRFGRRLDRLREPCGEWKGAADPRSLHELLEGVFRHEGASRVRLLLSPGDYAHAFAADGSTRQLPGDDKSIGEMLDLFTDGMFYELGIIFKVETAAAEEVEPDTFRIQLNDVSLPAMRALPADAFLVNETPDTLRKQYGVDAIATVHPTTGNAAALIQGRLDLRAACEEAGRSTWGRFAHLVLVAAVEVRAAAGAFLNTDLLAIYMEQLSRAFPSLVDETAARFPRAVLTGILRTLLDEGISIRDLRTILDALLGAAGTIAAPSLRLITFPPKTGYLLAADARREPADMLPEDFVECARAALRRYISHKYTRGRNTLDVFLLHPAIEDQIYSWNGAPPSADSRTEILDAVREQLTGHSSTSAVVLTTVEIRRPLRELLRHAFPDLSVLSYQELSPDINIYPVSRISLRRTAG
jgi:hypothetical protein